MKKVGILTFHFADNYGAVLQCYALRRIINSFDECKAEIVNFIPPTFAYAKRWTNEYQRVLFERKRAEFKFFLERECNVTTPIIYRVDDVGTFDFYCVGSDQIWNTGKMWEEYFLPNLPNSIKKISYAASVGYSVEDYRIKPSVMKKYLQTFDSVSVREAEHIPLVESITNRQCECVLDPTLLLDAGEYETIVTDIPLRNTPFIFFFWLENDNNLLQGVEFVNALSRKYKLPIVHSLYNAPEFMFVNDGGNMFYEGIGNFLWYIKNAEYVITNSYHGTIFSILFQKSFYTFVVKSMRSRIDTLCEKLGIGDRVINAYLQENDLDKDVDYININKQIEIEKRRSISYLLRALGCDEKSENDLINKDGGGNDKNISNNSNL